MTGLAHQIVFCVSAVRDVLESPWQRICLPPIMEGTVIQLNYENSLTCTVLMAYYSAKAYYMNPLLELPLGKGFADVVYLPKRNIDKPALVVELKWNQSAEGAIAQIKDRRYADWLEGYTGKILLVGICYDEKKCHTCVIEEYKKDK